MKKRVFTIVLSLCMILTMLPFQTFAAEGTEEASDLIKLSTPTELFWGKNSHFEEGTLQTANGVMGWKVGDVTQSDYEIWVYDAENDEEPIYNFYIEDDGNANNYIIDTEFIEANPDSGTYYFEVQAVGDDITYSNSDMAKSGSWTYVKPSERLATIESPTWDNLRVTWAAPEYSYSAALAIDYFFAEKASEEPKWIGGTTGVDFDELNKGYADDSEYLIEDLIAENGNGYYYFKVRAISGDITQIQNSEWSVLSDAYNVTGVSENIQTGLDKILDNSEQEDYDIRAAVQELDYDKLKTAMAADADVLETVKSLEEKTGTKVNVNVAEQFISAIAKENVEIIGAALNNVVGDEINLNITQPEKEHVLPALYNSTLAVSFAMNLDGVVNQEELQVPVRITLPIPKNINPEFLVILHYAQNGEVNEEISPVISKDKDGNSYATFMLDSFSDFVMTEKTKGGTGGGSGNTGGGTGGSGSGSGNHGGGGNGSSGGTAGTTVPDKTTDAAINTENIAQKAVKFTDVVKGSWYYEAVQYMQNKNLMSGVSEKQFAPNAETTRAMIVTILYRMENEPAVSGNGFSDVDKNQWYANAVTWAANNHVVNGYGNSVFGPNDIITREQMASILYRYAQYKGYDISGKSELSAYGDASSISKYAEAPLQWAKSEGLINGTTNTTISPNGSATRAQIAVMLMRFCENAEK